MSRSPALLIEMWCRVERNLNPSKLL